MWLNNNYYFFFCEIYVDKSLQLAKHMNLIINTFFIRMEKTYPEVGCNHLQVARLLLYF